MGIPPAQPGEPPQRPEEPTQDQLDEGEGARANAQMDACSSRNGSFKAGSEEAKPSARMGGPIADAAMDAMEL